MGYAYEKRSNQAGNMFNFLNKRINKFKHEIRTFATKF